MMDKRKTIKKADILVIGIIFILAVFLYVIPKITSQGDVEKCSIRWDGVVVKTVDLGKDGVFQIEEVPQMEFEIKNGRIAVIHSDCPDKVCKKAGFIGEIGQKIVCLPNKIVVAIENEKQGMKNADEPDVIVQ